MQIFNSEIFIIYLITVETILLLFMAFTAGRKYVSYPKINKIIWRIVLLIPIGLIIILSAFNGDNAEYKFLIFAGFCSVFLADMVIIYNEIAGLIAFLAYHIINIINYWRIAENIDRKFLWVLFALIIVLWLVILKLSFSKAEYKKFLVDNKVCNCLRHPIYACLLIFIYILSVLISAWCGYRLFYIKNVHFLFPMLSSIGALVFAIGDYFIYYEMLKRPERPFHQI